MTAELSEEKEKPMDIDRFISIIRQCKNPDQISDVMFAELVDKIVVHEAEGKGSSRTQQVDIYFNYVGQVNIALTAEELAEQKAQTEQEEKERLARKRQREKEHRERRKAKKLEASGGETVKKKVCPRCGAEFIPDSNRQIYCSRDCWKQDYYGKKNAESLAKREGHPYSQRECAICGKAFWPHHSQQTLCSEECQKESHNKVSLAFYHAKRAKSCENSTYNNTNQQNSDEQQEVAV